MACPPSFCQPRREKSQTVFLADNRNISLHQNKRQEFGAGFELETKNAILLPAPEEKYLQSANPGSDDWRY
jgi:hypothetical protein